MNCCLPLGAFDVALDRCSGSYQTLLEELFRTRARPARGGETAGLRMSLRDSDDADRFGADDALRCRKRGARIEFLTDVIGGRLTRGDEPVLSLWIRTGHPRRQYLDHYLRIVINAAFRRLGRVRLHGAAIAFAGQVSLFLGDKGAGKTTVSLHLARAGGTVLGEDQIMVRRRSDSEYLVAGGDDLMRVTAKTEARFFAEPLDEPAVLLAGTRKKEIRAARYLPYALDQEWAATRLFFPSVGKAFDVRPITRREALARLAQPLLPIHRFSDADDRRDFLAFLVGWVRRLEAFELTLSEDLDELDRLADFLR